MNLTVTWPQAYGPPPGTGHIRTLPEDFQVTETLAFTPSGEGEHVFLYLEKIGENTEYVARLLARHAQVTQRDIGYAGLKDRHAVTRQWFSVWLPGKPGNEPDWTALNSDTLTVLATERHARKLKRGVLAANHFKITVRDWQGDPDATAARLQLLQQHGIPNYYGEQRFGYGGHNVHKALAMFDGAKVGREQRGWYLSAARSWLFNQLLAQRVANQTWNQGLAGDCFVFDRSNSCFQTTQTDAEILARVAAGTLHPTAMLYGKGATEVSGEPLALEQQILAEHPALADGLLCAGLKRDRRALRVNLTDLHWQYAADGIWVVEFSLPPGSFATSVLREWVTLA